MLHQLQLLSERFLLLQFFRLKEAETTNMTTGHNRHDTLLGWLGEKNA